MDLNHLFHRHQVTSVLALRAACSASRAAHRGLAAGYAARIVRLQNDTGAVSPFRP